ASSTWNATVLSNGPPFPEIRDARRAEMNRYAPSESTSVPNDHSRILAKTVLIRPRLSFRRLWGCREKVAHAAHRADLDAIAALQLSPQMADVDVQRALVRRGFPLVKNRGQLVARNHARGLESSTTASERTTQRMRCATTATRSNPI